MPCRSSCFDFRRMLRVSFVRILLCHGVCIPRRQSRQEHPFRWLAILSRSVDHHRKKYHWLSQWHTEVTEAAMPSYHLGVPFGKLEDWLTRVPVPANRSSSSNRNQSKCPRGSHFDGSTPCRSSCFDFLRMLRTSFRITLLPQGVCIPRRQFRHEQPFRWLDICGWFLPS